MESIDLKCAGYGSRIAADEKVEQSLVNSALAVLLEQGVYAVFLFLCSRTGKEKKAAKSIHAKLFELIKEYFSGLQEDTGTPDKTELMEAIRKKFQKDYEDIFFAKDLIEKVLVYARYHIKSREKNQDEVDGT